MRGTNHTAAAILGALNGPSEVQTVAPTARQLHAQLPGSEHDPDRASGANDTPGRHPERAAGRQRGPGDHVHELQLREPRQHLPAPDRRQDDAGRSGSRRRSATRRRSPTRTSATRSTRSSASPGTVTVTGASATDRPDDHVRGRHRAQGRAAGRGRVRRLHRRGDAVQRGQPRDRQGQRGRWPGWPSNSDGHGRPGQRHRLRAHVHRRGRRARRSASPAAPSQETAKGTPGLLPSGTVATVGTVADTGYTLTFAGTERPHRPAPADRSVNGTGHRARGGQGHAGRGQLALRHDGDDRHRRRHRLHASPSTRLTPLGSARQTGLGDVSQLDRHRRDDRHGDDHHAGQVRASARACARTAATATSATTSSPSAGCS